MNRIASFKNAITYILALLSFGLTFFLVTKIQCIIESGNNCYYSKDAWFMLPTMGMLPAAITLAIAYGVEKLANPKKYNMVSIVIHGLVSVALLHLWLGITGHDQFSKVYVETDIVIFVAGSVMAVIV